MSSENFLDSGRRFGGSMNRLLHWAEDLRRRYGEALSPGAPAPAADQQPIPAPVVPPHQPSGREVLTIATASFPAQKPTPFEFRGYPPRKEDTSAPRYSALPISRRRFGSQLRRLEIPALDVLYINVASRILQSFRQQTPVFPIHEFLEFIQDQNENTMVKLSWQTLMKLTNDQNVESPLDLLKGARRIFEKRYFEMVKEVVRTGNQLVESGNQMDESYIFQHYAACRFSHDTSFSPHRGSLVTLPWRTLYDALRSGRFQAVAVLSKKLDFPLGFMEYSPEELISGWLDSGGLLPLHHLESACVLCSSMLEGAKHSLLTTDEIYMIMTLAFISGQIKFVDVLMNRTGHTWDSFDEYVWFAIGCVRHSTDSSSLMGLLSIQALQERFNAFTEDYYTEQDHGSGFYLILLLCSLQFKKAVYYVLKMEDPQKWISHAVHLAIAMEAAGILDMGGPEDEKVFSRHQIAQVVEMYGKAFAQVDLQANWQYQFFAARLRSPSEAQNEEILLDSIVDVLSRHNSLQDTELSRGAKEALIAFEPNPVEREALYETLGNRILTKGDFDLAFKAFLAGNDVEDALHTINKQITAKLRDLPCEPLLIQNKQYFNESTTHIALLSRKFATIHNRLQGQDVSRVEIRKAQKESNAIHEVFNMMSELWKGKYVKAMELFQELEFVPKRQQDISSYLIVLQEELPLVYSILDKVFCVFCRCCQSMEKKENWRRIFEEQIIVFQRFLEVAAQNGYSFANQVSRDLAQALSKLQTT